MQTLDHSESVAEIDDELRELYQAIIVEHGRRPRHFVTLDQATHIKSGINPLCGDQILLQCKIKGNTIEQAGFSGQGCAICMASCSLMLQQLQGVCCEQARKLFDSFHALLTDDSLDAETRDAILQQPAMDKLQFLQGVKAFPIRVKCATLAWQTLRAILDGDATDISTE